MLEFRCHEIVRSTDAEAMAWNSIWMQTNITTNRINRKSVYVFSTLPLSRTFVSSHQQRLVGDRSVFGLESRKTHHITSWIHTRSFFSFTNGRFCARNSGHEVNYSTSPAASHLCRSFLPLYWPWIWRWPEKPLAKIRLSCEYLRMQSSFSFLASCPWITQRKELERGAWELSSHSSRRVCLLHSSYSNTQTITGINYSCNWRKSSHGDWIPCIDPCVSLILSLNGNR
jgi:hypothetical protein